jgi:hypothetical protein
MRFTSISSSIASVVNRVIGFVAGAAVRTFLHLTQMREHLLLDLGFGDMRYWLEPCQPGFTNDRDIQCLSRLGNPQPGKRPSLLRLLGITAPVVCLTPSAAASAARLDSVRSQRLG